MGQVGRAIAGLAVDQRGDHVRVGPRDRADAQGAGGG